MKQYRKHVTAETMQKLNNMSCEEMLCEVLKRKLKGVMFHHDVKNIMNLMNLHGYKRQHEYQMLEENKEFLSLERFYIERIGKIPTLNDVYLDYNPQNIKQQGTRESISKDVKRKIVYDIYKTWKEWECETIELLSDYATELYERSKVEYANRVLEIVKSTDKEYKHLCRCYIKWVNLEWNIDYMILEQQDIHDKYEKKCKAEHNLYLC